MGVTVRQKVKGRGKPWWVFVAHNGKRTSKQVGDKEAAEKVASAIRTGIKKGDFGIESEKESTPSFSELAKLWITLTVPATCKPSTIRNYQDLLNLHVLPVFGNKSIDKITRGDVKTFMLNKVNGGYARNTVCHMRDVISGVLNSALDEEIIVVNPALRLGKMFTGKLQKTEIDPLTAGELHTLLETAREHYPEHYPLFLLLARTGMRIGEAVALQYGDCDFHNRYIKIQRSQVLGKLSTPKSGKSRKVDMSFQLAETLKRHHKRWKERGLAMGLGGAPEYMFVNEAGKMLDKDNWRKRIFYKVLEKSEMRKTRIHDIRHSYATLRIAAGHNIADVSNQLGHHSVKLTLDTYYHWIPGKKKSEVDALDNLHPSAPPLHPPQKKELAV